MKKIFVLAGFVMVSVSIHAQNKVNPVIKHFGTVSEIPYAVEKPDPKMAYKVLVEVNTDNPKPETVHEFFEKAAAVVNLHALGGISGDKLKMVLIIHGPAAQFVVNDAEYQKRFNTKNPNLLLFQELEQAGVKIFVCGQSLEKRKIDPATVTPEVKVALSAMTTLTTYELKGYALLKF